MNPANIPGTHHTFRWKKHSDMLLTCDMPNGTFSLRKIRQGGSSFSVRWNNRYTGMGFNLKEARALAERLYMEGRL